MSITCLFVPKRGNRYVLWSKQTGDGKPRRLPVGGRLKESDVSLYDAAAREAQEESGITPILEETLLIAIVENTHRDCELRNRLMFWFMGTFHGTPRAYPEEDMMDPRAYPLDELPTQDMWPSDRRWLVPVLKSHERDQMTHVYQRRFVYVQGSILGEELLRNVFLTIPIFPP